MTIKKILFLHQGAFWNRGSEKVVLCLLSNLNPDSFEAVLVCNHKLLATEAEKHGIKTLQIKWPEVMIDKDYIRLQFIRVLRAIIWLKTLIKRESIDIVVCNSGLPYRCLCPISFCLSPDTARTAYSLMDLWASIPRG